MARWRWCLAVLLIAVWAIPAPAQNSDTAAPPTKTEKKSIKKPKTPAKSEPAPPATPVKKEAPPPAEKKASGDFEPVSGDYLVIKEGAVLRDAPRPNAGKIGTVDVGARIEATGRARNGEWVAVRHNGKDGFLPGNLTVRLIDGRLERDLTGRAHPSNGPDCSYTIRFDGRSRVEGEIMDTADYWVSFKCQYRGRPLNFTAFMFLTEAPYDLSPKEVHQLSVEVNDAGAEYDEALAATVMYHRTKGELTFDGATPRTFAAPGGAPKRSVKEFADVLRGAVEMAVAAWNQEAWKELAKH